MTLRSGKNSICEISLNKPLIYFKVETMGRLDITGITATMTSFSIYWRSDMENKV